MNFTVSDHCVMSVTCKKRQFISMTHITHDSPNDPFCSNSNSTFFLHSTKGKLHFETRLSTVQKRPTFHLSRAESKHTSLIQLCKREYCECGYCKILSMAMTWIFRMRIVDFEAEIDRNPKARCERRWMKNQLKYLLFSSLNYPRGIVMRSVVVPVVNHVSQDYLEKNIKTVK